MTNMFKTAAGEIDFDALPEISRNAIISRGFTHFFGNEQASKVVAKVKAFEKENEGKTLDDGEKETLKAGFVAEALVALVAGTVGTRFSGPRVTGFEKALRDVAREGVTKILQANKLAVPSGKETVLYKGENLTMNQLIDRRLANEKFIESDKKEAQARVKASERMAKAAEGSTLDDL